MKILRTGTSIKQPVEERYAIQLDPSMPGIIRYPEEEIYQRTSPYDAGSFSDFPNRVRRIKIHIRSGTYANGLKRRQTPGGIHVKNIQRYREMI